jgi:hypothetical protein
METINGKIGIPPEYFLKMAKHDYNSYREALPREFYQNSIDAGATKIEVTFDEEAKTITITDDGWGMDKDVILNKLLVLGGSHKGEGAVGAFGKAKEILFFSWLDYFIHSNEWVVKGQADSYSLDKDEMFVGTKIVIHIQDDEWNDYMKNQFANIASRIETRCKIFVNGEEVETKYVKGKKIKETDFGTFYLQEGENDTFFHVRINGIWMFSRYIEGNNLGGRLILELNKSSLECLTSNRDGMKYEFRQKLESTTNEMVVDSISFLKPEKKKIRKKLEGIGRVISRDKLKQKIETYIGAYSSVSSPVVSLISEMTGIPQEVLDSRMAEINKSLYDEQESLFWASYKPDFILTYEQGQSAEVDKFAHSKKAETIAMLWTETIKQVLIDNEMFSTEFTAGFCFEDSMLAGIENDDSGFPVIYLNPFEAGKAVGLDSSNLLTKRSLLIESLRDRAIHELAHLTTNNHNEYFVREMARLRSATHGKQKNYNAISKIRV